MKLDLTTSYEGCSLCGRPEDEMPQADAECSVVRPPICRMCEMLPEVHAVLVGPFAAELIDVLARRHQALKAAYKQIRKS